MLRKAPLAIAGPSGNDAVPSFPTFLSHLLIRNKGPFGCSPGRWADQRGAASPSR
jgi:hypothetical protein